jgi:hypothetical protein
MNCGEFEHVLPDYLEGSQSLEQKAHLKSCATCSDLVADLNLISSQAILLRASDDPSPRVWNSLESQLRREGLIHGPMVRRPSWRESLLRWRTAWVVPVAAAMIMVAGIKLYHPARIGDGGTVARRGAPAPATAAHKASVEDSVILDTVAARPPAQRASYRADLDRANAYIRDAEQSVRNDPNDVYSQQLLINAYEQKQMLYDLAVDRSEGVQ